MKTLILAVKLALQTGLSDDVRAGDVYVTPHINYIPRSVKMPCVAIADGGSTRQELVGGDIGGIMRLKIVVYCDLAKDEAVIVGDASTGKKGLLELVAAVHGVLHGKTLDLEHVLWAHCPSESAAELFGDDTAMVCRKILDYEYVTEEG